MQFSENVAAIYLHIIVCLERFNQRAFLINESICLLNECVKSNVPSDACKCSASRARGNGRMISALKQSALSRLSGPNWALICAIDQLRRFLSPGESIKYTPARGRGTPRKKHTNVNISEISRERRPPSVVAPSPYQPLTANRSLMFDGHPVRSTL